MAMEAIRTAYQLRVEAERAKSSTENSQDSTIPNEVGDFMILAMLVVYVPPKI